MVILFTELLPAPVVFLQHPCDNSIGSVWRVVGAAMPPLPPAWATARRGVCPMGPWHSRAPTVCFRPQLRGPLSGDFQGAASERPRRSPCVPQGSDGRA